MFKTGPNPTQTNHGQLWLSSAATTVENAWKRLAQRRTVGIHRQTQTVALGTVPKHHHLLIITQHVYQMWTNITRPSCVMIMLMPLWRPSNVLTRRIQTVWGCCTRFQNRSLLANQQFSRAVNMCPTCLEVDSDSLTGPVDYSQFQRWLQQIGSSYAVHNCVPVACFFGIDSDCPRHVQCGSNNLVAIFAEVTKIAKMLVVY